MAGGRSLDEAAPRQLKTAASAMPTSDSSLHVPLPLADTSGAGDTPSDRSPVGTPAALKDLLAARGEVVTARGREDTTHAKVER